MNMLENFKDGLRYNLILSDEENSVDIIASYIAWGIKNNKRVFYFTDKDYFEQIDYFLNQYEVDLIKIVAWDKLHIESAEDFFVKKRAYVRYVNLIKLIEETISQGYSGAAIIADRDCFIDSGFTEETLYEYEKAVDKIFSQFPVSGISCYNIDRFGVDAFFALTHLNPNFIYKRDNQIYVHNDKEVIFDKNEMLGFVNYFLKESQRTKKENKIYQFVSKLSTEISYRKDEKEIVEISLNNICKSSYVDCGVGVFISEGVVDSQNAVYYMMPEEAKGVYIKLIYANELYRNDKFKKINYMTFNTEEQDDNIRESLNASRINYSTIIPLRYDEKLYGCLWLATRNKYISYDIFKNHVEFLFRICEIITKMIIEYRRYRSIEDSFMESREMKALGEMAGGIAHEFNNLLVPILGYTRMLKDKACGDECLKYISMIEDSARDGARIVKRIQDFSKNSNKEKELVDVDRAIVKSVEITKHKWNSPNVKIGCGIDIDMKLNSNGLVEGVSTEVKEIFINIITNAVDAMSGGGKIIIESFNEGDYVVIKIRDSGTGMDEEVRSKIFDPFFTTKREHGNGLGLPIVYSIITDMKGEIRVDSEVGIGSEFTIKLPLKFGDVYENGCKTGHIDLGKYKILVIDDNLPVAQTVSEMLSSIGHDVTSSTDSHEVIETFIKNKFDCVICDLGMVNFSGIELSRIFKTEKPETIFILMTGWPEGLKENELVHIDAVVQKPFLLEEICEVIYNAMKKKIKEG